MIVRGYPTFQAFSGLGTDSVGKTDVTNSITIDPTIAGIIANRQGVAPFGNPHYGALSYGEAIIEVNRYLAQFNQAMDQTVLAQIVSKYTQNIPAGTLIPNQVSPSVDASSTISVNPNNLQVSSNYNATHTVVQPGAFNPATFGQFAQGIVDSFKNITGSGSGTGSTSDSSIPSWVWLAGGGAVVLFFIMGKKGR